MKFDQIPLSRYTNEQQKFMKQSMNSAGSVEKIECTYV